jgi:hypothetical protein
VVFGYSGSFLLPVLIQGTLFGIRALGKGTGIIFMVGAAIAQESFSTGTVQGDAGMTIGFENKSAMGTGDRLGVDGLMAFRAIRHLLVSRMLA